ncbi:MAG: 50S ribosomal protein L25/general stress protein Ctc [Bacteroidales bacterium]|nr:50S ribosomal protein L25/general stress protein Ctc [Bacteroidales bacterium]
MKTVSMSGALRAHVGKKDAKKVRKDGKVPCVLYGGEEQIHFSMDEKDFTRIVFTPEVFLIELTIDGKQYRAVLQDIQYHPVTDSILHADFLEVLADKAVTVGIPVRLEGNSIGVLKGGMLFKKMREIKLRGLVEDFPDFILLNIDNIDIGDAIRIRDIQFDNIQFIDAASTVVVSVKTARGAGMEEEEEEAAEVAEGAEGAEEGGTEEKAEGKPAEE